MGPVKLCRTISYSHESKYIPTLRSRVIAIIQVSETRYSYIYARFLPTGSFYALLSFTDFSLHVVQNEHLRKISPAIAKVSNNFDPNQARRFVGSDVGPNCLLHVSYQQTPLVHVGSTFMHIFAFCAEKMFFDKILVSGCIIIQKSFVSPLIGPNKFYQMSLF